MNHAVVVELRGDVLQLKIGIQLESLRLPFRAALRAAAEIGASAVEINARTELRPDELSRTGVRHLRKLLSDLNLTVCSLNFPTRRGFGEIEHLEMRIEAAKGAMSAAHQLGAKVVVCQIGAISEEVESADKTLMLQALSDLGRHGHRVGAWLAARTGLDSGERLASLIDVLPPVTLGVDFDPGSLIINGHSPESAMRRLADRVVSFRAFDAVRDSRGLGLHVQLGRGSVDFPLLLGLLEERHYNGFIVIERRAEQDSVLSCQQTVQYLKSLF